MSKKVMISQPMADKKEEEIAFARNLAISRLEHNGYEIVPTLFLNALSYAKRMQGQGIINFAVSLMGRGIDSMSHCHAVYFCEGWESSRGCKIEHEIAKAYGLEIIYEEIGGEH